jgi:DNA-binding transcriptional regulator YhcF (GntR family)
MTTIPRRTRARRRARDYLLGVVDAARRKGTARLPTIAALAAGAGVACATMRREVAELRAEGLLLVSHGSGIRLSPAASGRELPLADVPSARPAQGWQKLRMRMEQDLLRGVYRPAGMLPRIKELAGRYGVCYRTLRKALDALLADGRLEASKKGCRVPFATANGRQNTIVLVVRGAEAGRSIGTWAPRNREQFSALEKECTLANVKLEFAIFQYRDGVLVGADGGNRLAVAPERLPSVLGFMVWTQGLADLGLPAFCDHLARYGRPVAVLDVSGGEDFRSLHHTGSLSRVFALGFSQRCGEIVGRYLLGLGHRRLVYICSAPGARAAGLREAFAAAGFENAVDEVIYAPGGPGGVGTEAEAFDYLLTHGLDERRWDHRTLKRALQRFRERLAGVQGDEAAYEMLEPAVEQALAVRDATAWVAWNDQTALRCLELLERRGVRLPQDLSLAGFDDVHEAFLEGLTSYNFNVEAIVHAMMTHILRPQPFRPVQRRAPVEIDGFVNTRRTTGKPRAGA